MTAPEARLAEKLADRYVLERKIGAGGMATVYLARDIRHKRWVAVKVVRPDLRGLDAVDRFLREIELVARLQHPHILPVFDSGVVGDGTDTPAPYFVMPYVEGETLRQRLEREGPLLPSVAIGLVAELADALAYAHAQGVVHRDIKPENILLSGGHAVVADFGVAKALADGAGADVDSAGTSGTPTPLTGVGLAIGTPEYMSPEQAIGQGVVDARADQYSLGCVLYEMLAGKPPFRGTTPQAVLANSLNAPRPRLASLRSDVAPEVEKVLARALALDPDDRYPDMTSLGEALDSARPASRHATLPRLRLAAVGGLLATVMVGGWLLTRSARPLVASAAATLAVLPFESSGPGAEFSGEGVMDLLATNLQGVAGIKTTDSRRVLRGWTGESRESNRLKRALSVGRRVGARSVVLGSVATLGGRVRLAASLHAANSGERLGQARVNGHRDSVLTLVDQLSIALLRDVWRSREPIPRLNLASITTSSLPALRAYLEGEGHLRRLAFDSAVADYSRAVEADSTFALAHLRLASAYGWIAGYDGPQLRQAAAAAFRYADRLPVQSRRLLGGYQLYHHGSTQAIDSLRSFVSAYPGDLEGRFAYGEALFHLRQIVGSDLDTVLATFDTVIYSDSTLVPALIHPLELTLRYRDSARFNRYFTLFERTAPAARVASYRTAARIVWGPAPTDSAVRASLNSVPYPLLNAVAAAYRHEAATSDTVLVLMERLRRNWLANSSARRYAPINRGYALLGFGRLQELRALVDTVAMISPGAAGSLLGLPIALEIAPRSYAGSRLDSLMIRRVTGLENKRLAAYYEAFLAVISGEILKARRKVAAGLSLPDSSADSAVNHGLLEATAGWARLVEGDAIRGIEELRSGIARAGADAGDATEFFRYLLAVTLAARPDTRQEGIRRLKFGFDETPYLIPLCYFALGKAYNISGHSDSAVVAYRRFLSLWDKADPDPEGMVNEARQALEELRPILARSQAVPTPD